ncbi:MAG: phosphodiester glycosidase family protein, partial [Clostridia bacterium]|nr:phosphodiester glycosidase family protein [Clostridia bacterium]
STDEVGGEDEWADAIDGIKLINITKPSFKAYLLMVKDPSRVFVGTSSDFQSGLAGARIFDIVEKYGAVAAINGGEYPDTGGVGSGHVPIGITYAEGKMVWSGPTYLTFMGLTKDNKLVVSEGMTKARADELGMRDGVCFQTGNCLITNDGVNMTLHYSDRDTGRAQRTAIGQRADGTMLLLVTDGRTTSSIGATHNELISLMLEYGAVCAGKLDGGSSAMMYYRNYYDLYDYDMSTLDEYQRKGLVNSYKAFTEPRRIPTYFIVGGSKS